tara:strand:- start:211 stop:492 length:282 start_codon:yes stop_codon:yes gene_type:complete
MINNLTRLKPNKYKSSEVSTGMYIKIQVADHEKFPAKIPTESWMRVVGTRDGIKVRRYPNPSTKHQMPDLTINLNNIIDLADGRGDMIAKRDS